MDQKSDRGLAIAVGVLAALLLINAGLCYLNTQDLNQRAGWVAHTLEVEEALADVQTTVTKAEAGQRGYLLTGDEPYLDPYHAAVKTVPDKVNRIERLTEDNPYQQKRIPRLRERVQAAMDELSGPVRLRKDQQKEAALAAMAGSGKRTMEAVHAILDEMMQEEKDLLHERQARTDQAYLTAVLTGILAAFSGLMAVGVVVLLGRRFLTARLKAAVLLRQEREWLRVSLTSIGDAVIATDTRGQVSFLNPTAQALTGWTQEEAQGRPLEEVFPIINEGTRQPVENPVARVLREGVVIGLANHTALVARGGPERPIEDSAAPIKADDGSIVGVILVFHDVSERRRQAKALEERTAELTVANSHLKAIFHSVQEGIAVFDREANLIFCNDAEARIAGFASPEEMQRNLSFFAEVFEFLDTEGELVPVDQWPVSRVLRGESFTDWECHGRRKDTGQEWEFSFSGSPVKVENRGQVFSVVVTRDITERKRAERALRESEESFRTSFELAAVGKVQIDPTTRRFLRVNQKFCEITGYGPDELLGLTPLELTHPNDREEDGKNLSRMLRGEVPVYSNDKRYVRKDGSAVWVNVTATLVRDGEGRPVRTIGVVQDLSARRAAEEALRQSETRKAAILDTALDGIITIDHKGQIIEFNRAAESIFGYRRQDVVGRDMAGFIIPPPQREAHRRGLARYLATGEGPVLNRRIELIAVRADGLEFPVELAIAPIPGELPPVFTGFVRDITQRKAAETALRESEERFRTLADSIPQLAWTARPDGYIFWYNRRWYEYTGTTPEQMEGWGWQSVHDPQELPNVLERWKGSIATGEPFDMVLPLKGRDGVFRPFLTRVMPVRSEDGRILQWFGTNTDISEIKEMEAKLKAADRRKDQFVMMLAHELRNPLAPIRNSLQVLQAAEADRTVVDKARRMMARQIGHMARIIDDLLDVSRLVRGRVELRLQRLDLGRLTREALEDQRPALDQAGLSLDLDVPEVPVWVNADPTRLTQILDNLVQNAVKFTGRGGKVTVGVSPEGTKQKVLLTLRDTGVGIEPDLLPHLFETFTQADRSLDRSKGGLGLGLSLVKGLVELHGGEVHAASGGPGQGAAFSCGCPCSRSRQSFLNCLLHRHLPRNGCACWWSKTTETRRTV